MPKLPRILIFTPTYEGKDYCLPQFLEHVNALTYPKTQYRHIIIDNSERDKYWRKLLGLGLDAHRISRGSNSREALARAQNYARKIAIDEGYDYILSLESDIMVPPNIVELLLAKGLDVVTALYFLGDRNKGWRVPCITVPQDRPEYGYWGTRLLNPEEWPQYLYKGTKQVAAGGMGCCLIYRKVFERIPFTYEPGLKGHSDVYFFNDCFRLKIPVFVDTNIVCDHQNSNWGEVKDR